MRISLDTNVWIFGIVGVDPKYFYQFVYQFGLYIDFEKVPLAYIREFEQKGLKKGDAEIGAFCEWRQIDILVSDNRDFLRGLSAERSFQVMAPQEFCAAFIF